MNIRSGGTTFALFAAIIMASLPLRADDALAEIRKLYASAYYERALAALEQIGGQAMTPGDQQSVRRYKALCLIALDRVEDAERVTNEIVQADPMTGAYPGDPPRLRSLIHEARARVLPELVRELYTRARTQYEQKSYADAAADFESVVSLLGDESLNLAVQPELADLGLLARGFRDLLRLESRRRSVLPAREPMAASVPELSADAGHLLVPSVAIEQVLPKWPNALRALLQQPREGVIEVVVGVDGSVESATMVTPIHLVYDRLLLAAAQNWKYHPALRNGVPIPSTKVVRVALTAAN